MAAEPRREARQNFDDRTRLALLEGDADRFEREAAAFRAEIRREVRTIKNMALGVMVSATTATIVGAINLAYGFLG